MVIMLIRAVAPWPAEPVALATRRGFFREISGIPPVLLARYRRWPRADGPRARGLPGAGPGSFPKAITRHAALPRSGPHPGRPAPECMADGRTALSQHRRRSPGRRRAARRSSFLLPVAMTA